MYRLTSYGVGALVIIALIYSLFGVLPYNFFGLLFSALLIFTVCLITDVIFSWALDRESKFDPVFISAMILVLIITPIASPSDSQFFSLAIWASIWAMASKYILTFNQKNIVNPAAFAVALTSLTLGLTASWWVGNLAMLPYVIVVGLLVIWKIKKFGLVLSFLIIAIITNLGIRLFRGADLFQAVWQLLANSPLFFFGFIMLTEPKGMPLLKGWQNWFGAIVGFLFSPFMHLGAIYSTPELALLIGNIFAFISRLIKKNTAAITSPSIPAV